MSDSYGWLIPIVTCACAVLFVLGVGGAIFFALNRSGKAVNRAWGDLGTRFGLMLKPMGMFTQPELKGEFRQRPIRLYLYSSGSQGNRETCTAVTLTLKQTLNSALEITPAGTLGNFLGKVVKAQDVEIGSPEFDARYVIKSDPPDFAGRVLGSVAVQTGIMAIPEMLSIELKDQSLEYSRRGVAEDPELLARVFNTLNDLADAIER
jgi:hypothetical protein